MDSLRLHTVFMDIRGIRNIKYPLIYDFIADQLQLTPSDVQAIQIDLTEGKVFIELPTQQKVQEVIEEFDGRLDFVCDNKSHKVRLFVEDGGIDIKLHHLPRRMPEEWISQHMQKFGNVLNIKDEMCKSSRFPNTPSGVKIIRMQLRRAIPSYISIRGYSTYCTYDNQVQTCRHCGNIMHKGRGCAENRARLTAEERLVVSYADIAANTASTSKSPTQSPSIWEESPAEMKSKRQSSDPEQIGAQQQHQNTKRPATVFDDLDNTRRGKSAKTVTVNRNASTERRDGDTVISSAVAHGNPSTSISTNLSTDTTEMIIDEEGIHTRGRSSRAATKTTASKSREASRSHK